MKYLGDQGSFVGTSTPDGPLTIGGSCNLRGAVSPNTGAPLVQHASVRLDPGTFRMDGWASPEIHFLYSWKCDIHLGDFSYRQADGTVMILEYRASRSDLSGFPYDGYPAAFQPRRFDFAPEPRAETTAEPLHQFGGVPILLLQEPEPKACVGCGAEMSLAATIGNRNFSNEAGFFGNDYVQIVYWVCPSCQIVAARNYCD